MQNYNIIFDKTMTIRPLILNILLKVQFKK